ncbi:MAG TPA: glycosyltransferase, partial [Chthonomonadales bacterium]|nr:glycosyltransferase [Chthonomonadales bacterium]
QGIAAIEAMAAERPVVASNTGGLPETVRDGETGILAPPGDVEALSAALAALLEDPALSARLGRAGRLRAIEQYDANTMARKVLQIYREMAVCGD